MAELKLAKLPNRTPVKITITVSPILKANLDSYAEAYRQAYGERETEPVSALIPYILESFLESDRGFTKKRKQARNGAAGSTRTPSSERAARNVS
ncbi:MAG: DUF2274 domain-containing protein [Rhodospirillaceae bacterium]|nr:MAG: DUF2274 domain-containing protein [Rhodospirillaceae bacterium]